MKISTKLLIGTAFAAFTFSANATLMLNVQDSAGNVATAIDSDADGVLTFAGSLGGWSVYNITGLANPEIGDAYSDAIHLNSVEVSKFSTGSGSLTIMLTQTDMTKNSAPFQADFGGTTDGSIDFQLFMDTSNTAFGIDTSATAVQLYDSTGFSGGAFSDSFAGGISTNQPYSMTMLVTINHDAGRRTTSFDYDVKVPEPGFLAVFGAGLIGLAFASRKKK